MSQDYPFNGINNVVFLKILLCEQLKCSREELDFKLVTNFSLEHRNLMKINCLWPLCNLRKLSLSSNAIKRIENLDSLTQLEDLDLSFNEISKIENLHTLTKLRRISFYANRIEVLENIENLKCLQILNVGANCINDKTCPFYLAQLKNLRCLVLNENPCYTDPDNEIDNYLLALMPQLMDLNNRRVTEKDRYVATTHYKMKTRGLKKFGVGNMGILANKQQKKQKKSIITIGMKLYNELFLEYKCFLELSEEGGVFKTLNQKLEENLTNLFQQARASKNQLEKKFEYQLRVLEDLEMESDLSRKQFICNVGDCLRSDENNKRRNLRKFRKIFLAEECDIQTRFEKLFDDLESKLKIESAQQIANLNDIHARLVKEIEAYITTVFKLITNYFHEATNSENATKNGRYWRTIDLKHSEFTFREHCKLFIDNLRNNIIKDVEDWEKQFIDMFQTNLIRHRKTIAETIKAVRMLNVD